MKFIHIIFFGLALIATVSCSKSSDENQNPQGSKDFELYIDFWNNNGANPQINFDGANSSPEIKIDFSKTFAGVTEPPNLTKVLIDNVRVIDENNVNYTIDKITAYEWRDDINDWKVDVEFIMKYKPVEDIGVVLALDASASLGEDFTIIKEYAKDFVSKIFSSNPSAQIAIVDFADEVHVIGPTNDRNTLLTYIHNIEQGSFTSLYEAMYLSIDSLQKVDVEGKAIATFTDGTDNNSDPQYTPARIYNKLTNDPNQIRVSSFTIGFEGNGGVDRLVLENLAANGGIAEFPNTVEELGEVFDKFSASISNVYNLTYIRNQQKIPQTDPAKLKFVLTASPK